MKVQVSGLATAACVLGVALSACGGGSGDATAATPNRSVVLDCMEHSGTGARIYQQQVPSKIGGLPAHVEITGVGYEEGDLEFGQTTIYLFENGDEGEEAVERLEQEEPDAVVNVYAGGTAVGVVSEANDPSRDEHLIQKCVEERGEE